MSRPSVPGPAQWSLMIAVRGIAAPFGLLAAGLLLFSTFLPCTAQQIPDTAFAPPMGAAEFPAGSGPRVVIDAAHLNFHTADGSYATFATLLRRAGYRVESNGLRFTRTMLDEADILVVANAMHPQSRDDWAPLPNLSAFSDEEIAAVEAWVRDGGSLLLIADHMPLAGHSETLAAAFGIRFLNGFALDRATGRGRITFRRADGSLPSSLLANGRGPDERVDSVTTFTGQAFRVDPAVSAEPLLVLSQDHDVVLPISWHGSSPNPRRAYRPRTCCKAYWSGTVAAAWRRSARRRCSVRNSPARSRCRPA